jgi:PTH1 family peptidyl-tRNA hydrolase
VGLGNPALVVGLGNPGSRYAGTRHNAGFVVVDELARRWGIGARDWQKKGEARYAIDRAHNAILVEPQSYMNLSGRPVQSIATFYKVPPERILVIVDDLDLPFGTLRMRASGSSGGHNGLKSLIEVFGQGFPRLRIGIGRGHDPDAIDRVLGDFSETEMKELPSIVDRAITGVDLWLTDGVTQAMNSVNAKV